MGTATRALRGTLCALCLLGPWPSAAAAPGSDEESAAIQLVNLARAAADLPPLVVEPCFTELVRAHSAEMVAQRALSHSAPEVRRAVAPTGWLRLGENVGYGDTVAHVHAQFMESQAHRDNVLGDFTGIAVGTRRSDDGLLFVTMVFVKQGPAPQLVAGRMPPIRVVVAQP